MKIESVPEAESDVRTVVNAMLSENSADGGFVYARSPVVLKIEQGGKIIAGLVGYTLWEWLHIEVLAVDPQYRGQGLGRQLIEQAEQIARDRKCRGAWVDTFSWQVPDFYENLDYKSFGTIKNYPAGQQRMFFRKRFTKTYKLRITNERPFFAELPYYLWGPVGYDSDGDCDNPLDRKWTWMVLSYHVTEENLEVGLRGDEWTVTGPNPAAARLALFMQRRCGGEVIGDPIEGDLENWDYDEAAARAAKVAEYFQNPVLIPFAQGGSFWGGWKWIGLFSSTFTSGERRIMDSVVRKDTRAVEMCIGALRSGPFNEIQAKIIRYALEQLTGLDYPTDKEWIQWYDSVGKILYPEPDMSKWDEDLQAIHGDS